MGFPPSAFFIFRGGHPEPDRAAVLSSAGDGEFLAGFSKNLPNITGGFHHFLYRRTKKLMV
jgi:hypothetical protein